MGRFLRAGQLERVIFDDVLTISTQELVPWASAFWQWLAQGGKTGFGSSQISQAPTAPKLVFPMLRVYRSVEYT